MTAEYSAAVLPGKLSVHVHFESQSAGQHNSPNAPVRNTGRESRARIRVGNLSRGNKGHRRIERLLVHCVFFF